MEPTADMPRSMAAAEACACRASPFRTASSVASGSGSPLASSFKRGSSSKSSCMCRSDSGRRWRVPRPAGSTSGSSRRLRALRCRRVPVPSACGGCVSIVFSWGIPRQYSLLRAIPTAPRMALMFVAEWTGLERATPGVTGRYSSQPLVDGMGEAFRRPLRYRAEYPNAAATIATC
jgi:hypothetical protein